MEGSIYNNINKEINFQLPDIDFDSDSDEIDDDDGVPIKPYIRPSAEILFGTDDSDSEEILKILSQLPPHKPDSPMENGGGDGVGTDGDRDSDENEAASGSMTEAHKRPSGGLPFADIRLPNGISTKRLPMNNADQSIKETDRVVLTRFGVRDNIDLDKVLEEIDLSSCQTTFFDDVLNDCEDAKDDSTENDSANNELLKNLDEISQKYAKACGNNYNNNNLQTQISSLKSLSSLFKQMQQEKRERTVYLDLRMENRLCCKNLNESRDDAIPHNGESQHDDHRNDSSHSDNDNKDETSSELWIDNYRKSKNKMYKKKVSERELNPLECSKSVEEVSDDPKERSENLEANVSAISEGEMGKENRHEKTPEHVRLKIEKIKQQEKILSERRYMISQLKQMCSFSGSSPPLLHEEISFETVNCRLIEEILEESYEKYFNAFISISPPNSLLTISKVASHFSVDHPKANFAALLCLLLQSTHDKSTCRLPFKILGLQQIFYQNQLQLALLCETSSSLSKLRMDLKHYTIGQFLPGGHESHPFLSSLPLSNLFRMQPYDPVLNNNIWQWNNSSILWHKIPVGGHSNTIDKKCHKLNVNTSCMVLQKDFFLSSSFRKFLETLLDRFTLAGIRLISNGSSDNQLVLAVRGFDAINIIKTMQSQPLYRDNVTCTRFCENSVKELSKYFGPRINEDNVKMLIEKDRCQEVLNELSYGISLYSSLCRSEPNNIMLLVSPLCLDVGWIINILQVYGGYVLINIARLNISVSVGRQIGISEKTIDFFESQNGICHLLILFNENPLHSIKYSLNECINFMKNDKSDSSYDKFFYPLPYSDALVDVFDIRKTFQTPEVRELKLTLPDAPFEDCEQISFVLIISDELTKHIAQILDQMSNLDLLAVKCFTNELDEDHLILIKTEFKLRLPDIIRHSSEEDSEDRMKIGFIVVRSMYVTRELEKIQNCIKIEKNLIFAYTLTSETTFKMIGSLFTSSELKSDSRRRSCLPFLPEATISSLNQKSILAQLPVLYLPIQSVLVLHVDSLEHVLSKFRKLLFLLTRDGFTITETVLGGNKSLYFVVERPNAIFYLTQWVKHHFNNDERIGFASNSEEVPVFLNKLPLTVEHRIIESLNYPDKVDLDFFMVKCNLLETSVEMLSNMKQFWNIFDENKCRCIGLSIVDVDGSLIFKLRNISLRNLSGNQIQAETRYLCLLVVSNFSGGVSGNLIRSKFDLLKSNGQLCEDIYVNSDREQITDCSNIVLHGVTSDDLFIVNID